jgi:nucleolar protein 56
MEKYNLRAKLFVCEAGLALFDESGNPIASARFQDDIYSKFTRLMSGEKVQELSLILEQARGSQITELINPYREIDALLKEAGIRTVQAEEERERQQQEKEELMLRSGLVFSRDEVLDIIREFAMRRGEERIREKSARLDQQVIQSIAAVDELDRNVNIMCARVREWFGLHFPELDSLVEDPLSYCRLVVELGNRSNFTEDRLKHIMGLSSDKGSRIAAAAERSRGGELSEEDLEPLKELAEGALSLAKLRDRIMRHVEKNMKRIAPNVTAIAGAAIGARLIARAGGMERLARLPSSTIQVLGAEKALFRALKSGGRPPKHGIIFQHNLIHSAQPWQRGKVARALASKIALAARVDFFRGEIDEELAKQTQVKVEEIKKKYPKPRESKPKERWKRRK